MSFTKSPLSILHSSSEVKILSIRVAVSCAAYENRKMFTVYEYLLSACACIRCACMHEYDSVPHNYR